VIANKPVKMKNISILVSYALLISVLASCNNASQTAKKDVENLSQYVDSVNKVAPEYTASNWESIDAGYQSRLAEMQITEAELKEEDKAKAEETKSQYETLKVAYKEKIKDAEEKRSKANNYRYILRNSLFEEGKVGDEIQFNFVNAKNIHSVYEIFVKTVDNKKDNYTREDWDEIKVLYEGLDTRKNEIEKDLASSDNMKIAKLKLKFATIRALNRGGAKVKENEEAKK